MGIKWLTINTPLCVAGRYAERRIHLISIFVLSQTAQHPSGKNHGINIYNSP